MTGVCDTQIMGSADHNCASLASTGMAQIDILTGWIALVLGESARLRAAGVLSIGGGGYTVTFAPDMAPVPAGEIDRPDATVSTEGLDPLHDPHSYPSGIVPGYTIERLDPED